MTVLALVLYGVYLLLAFGLRTLIQLRRTGSTGFHGLGGRPGSAEWVAGVGFAVALLLGAAAPVLALAGAVEPIPTLDRSAVQVCGLVLALAGIVATFYAQVAMGTSWRIGVDPAERTELVTTGPFALVRNPIFAAMLPTALGLTLMVPSWVAILGLAGLAIALELQVRVVEEPYLLRAHGEAYAGYASRVGRFVPGIGRLRAREAAGSPAPLLRAAGPADAPRLSGLAKAAYGPYVEPLGGPPRPMVDDYSALVREPGVTVAERGGEIVGMIVLAEAEEGFLIDNVAVDPGHQGTGVGRALLEHAEQAARAGGFDSSYLFTHEKMTENLALYARIGYVEYDRRDHGGACLVYLRKELPRR